VRGAFIGRDAELAELSAGLLDAIEGRGGVVLVTGEAGIGKTAIVERIATLAAERGVLVSLGRCWDAVAAPPYSPWVQIIRTIADGLDDETLRSSASSGAGEIALLAPDLGERLGESVDRTTPTDSDARRFYLFEAVTTFLKNASSTRPLVLILDDLHEADHPSLLLLRFLAKDVSASRILVLATYREHEGGHIDATEEVLLGLASESTALELRGLDRAGVRGLVEFVSGTVPVPAKVNAIHEATDGNPLFVREVTRLVVAKDRLDQEGTIGIAIPQSVRAVIRRRLAPLSADAVRVLSAAAVVGRDFDVRVVRLASDLANDRVLRSMSEAEALGVLNEPAALGVYRFSHPLIREVLYEDLPVTARIQLHRSVGEAIERVHGDDPRPPLAQLAHHFARAAPAGEGERALDYARRAGDQAMATSAYEEAVGQYRRALEALGFVGADEVLRCDVLLSLGGALVRAGEYDEAKSAYLSAVDTARKLKDAERLAVAALGYGEPQVEAGMVNRQLLALLQEALDVLGPKNEALRARVLARVSLELTFSDEAELREAISLEAIEIARRLHEVGALASALRARWLAVGGPDSLEERTALAEELLELARATGDREIELIGRARRATCLVESARIGPVETDIAAHAQLAGELRMPYHQWVASSMQTMRSLLQGYPEAAEGRAEAALAMAPVRRQAEYAHLNQITLIRWDQGRLGELRGAWQELADQFPQVRFSRGWLALADAGAGREDDARRSLRSLLDGLTEWLWYGNLLPALALAASATALLQDSWAAESVRPLVLPYAERAVVLSAPHPVVCFGSAALYVALAETTMSRWEEAEDHFTLAIARNTQLGARSLLARTQLEFARMLIRRGRGRDRGRALELLERAAATAADLDIHDVSREVERLGELHAGGAVTAPDRMGSVFRREGDYWSVVYEGSVVRLRDSKGLGYLATLLANPGREFHAVDLETMDGLGGSGTTPPRRGWTSADELDVRSDLGDAGEMLDATAKDAYRARVRDLRAELDEAEAFNDPSRAAKVREELAFIESELARAVGLGGRDRRAASHAERARLNVTRAIRSAMRNLARANPSLGEHLSFTIRTGRYCAYTPDPRVEISWGS
jgi:tetratricopeptide (TPR) repeat protein